MAIVAIPVAPPLLATLLKQELWAVTAKCSRYECLVKSLGRVNFLIIGLLLTYLTGMRLPQGAGLWSQESE